MVIKSNVCDKVLYIVNMYKNRLAVLSLSGNTLRVSYHLCTRQTLGAVFELHHSSENTHRYFHIIKIKKIRIGHHMQRNIIVY